MKYRKRAFIIDAFQLGVDEHPDWFRWAIASGDVDYFWTEEPYCFVNTLNGAVKVDYEDYIIKGVKDEIYPCKKDVFEFTYEEVDEDEEDDIL